MKDFFLFWLSNLIILIGNSLLLSYTVRILLRTPIIRKTFFLQILIFHFFLSLIITLLTSGDIIASSTNFFFIYLLAPIVQNGAYLFFMKKKLPNYTWSVILLLVTIPNTLLLFFDAYITFLYLFFGDILRTPYGEINYYLASIMSFLLTFISLFIWGKTPLVKWVSNIFQYSRLAFILGFTLYGLEIGQLIYQIQIINNFSNRYWLLPTISLGVFFLISVVAREVQRNNCLTHSEEMLAQQQIYVEHVELLYLQLRKVQHDYKNVFSGMYLQIKEGSIEAVEEYLAKNILSLDEGLQINLKQQQQLANIQLVEIKSLLLAKIVLAKRDGITLNIEVGRPMMQLTIDPNDFIRILGIAIDNAIEAAVEVGEQVTVHLLLLDEEEHLEIVIKNPYKLGMDKSRIFEAGYSTKGKNRGLGLSIFKEILGSYPNILRSTEITESYFIQSILIQRKINQ